jgi:MinD superfamily P-loop ATPase
MEIAIISGKGGTGKSSISAAFASLDEKVVLADCDVDAANMHILFSPEIAEEQEFTGSQKARIDHSVCSECGLCIEYCRFGAISFSGDMVEISETSCDGCKLCTRICPEKAITMYENRKSRMFSGSFRNGKMVYGRLAPGEENSGKLVNMVRNKAKELAQSGDIGTIIIDGPPGIGCPVISTITGVDHVVIVTEPTISGIHDLKRTVEITSKFNLKTWVLLNKSDLNPDMAERVEDYCRSINVDIIGKLPFSSEVVMAMVNCQSITEWAPYSVITQLLKKAYGKII